MLRAVLLNIIGALEQLRVCNLSLFTLFARKDDTRGLGKLYVFL